MGNTVSRIKASLVAYKGGKCMDCGGVFPQVCFQFDHRDPYDKLFSICHGYGRPPEELMREVDKCDLVCANCHLIRTSASAAVKVKQAIARSLLPPRKNTPEQNAKIGAALRGRPKTAMHARNVSLAKKGIATIPKGTPRTGHALESLIRLNKSRAGRVVSEETRRKIGMASKNRTAETRLKLSLSARFQHREKGRWTNEIRQAVSSNSTDLSVDAGNVSV
jgi:hypothetical protein